jgi:MFS superfamily sulfate permease-like transporter
LAVIIYQLIQDYGIEAMGPIIVLAGVFQMLAGMLKVGQMFRSIAPAVVYGMLAGIGVLIFAAQFHVMVDDGPRSNGIRNLLAIPEAVYKGITPSDDTVHHLAAIVGLATIVAIVGWAKFAPKKVKWIPGALIGVLAATGIAHAMNLPIKYVDLPDNLFATLQTPSLSMFASLADYHMVFEALALAFVASAETLLSATAVDQMHGGKRTNYDKEMFSQGVGNCLCGLVGGLPMTGVIVRSATNVSAGAKTRLSAIMHGAWLLILVAAAPSVLRLIPTASLAAVLVYTGYKLVNVQNIRRLLHYGRMPVIIYGTTVVLIVVEDLLTGIVAGLVLSLGTIIYSVTHLGIRLESTDTRVEVHLEGSATFLRMPKLIDALEKLPNDVEVRVHTRSLTYVDHACLDAISNWEQQRGDNDGKTVVEWHELMSSYQRLNGQADTARGRPLVGAGH